MVRMAMARRSALSSAKAISMGLRSGCRAAETAAKRPARGWLARRPDFCGGQVVQDDDVAFLQRWDELGAHVGLEDRAVHRRVDDPRRRQSAAAQPGDESLGLPMAKGALERGARPSRSVRAPGSSLC